MKRLTTLRQVAAMALLLFAGATVLHAQQQPAQEIDEPSIEKLEAQFDEIEKAVAEFDRLEATLADSREAYRPLLQRRLYDLQKVVVDDVNRVSNDILNLESGGIAVDEYSAQAIVWLQDLTDFSKEFLTDSREVTAELLERRRSVTASDAVAVASALDRSLSRGVEGHEDLNQMLVQLDAFGIDVSEEFDILTERIREGAEMIAVAIQIAGDDMASLRYQLTLTPDNSDALVMLQVTELGRQGFAKNLAILSDILEKRGVDPSIYRRLVLVVTGDVASQILDTGVMSSLAQEWSITAWVWIHDNGLGWAVKLVVLVSVLLFFRALSRVTRRLVQRGVTKVNLSVLLRKMIVSAAGNVVMILGVLIALSQFGVSIGPLLAGLGVLGFIIGFALQDTLGNFASGMMILVYRPYDVGDIIEAGGVTGKVTDMSLVYTAIHTFDNQRMIVPNNKIWGDVIRNVTSQNVRRVDLVFGISYGDDIEKAEQVLQAIVDENEMTLDEPEPMIKLHTLNDSSVDFVVRPWARSENYWDVYWDITREVKMRFDREGISIPFPQRDVHVVGDPSTV